MSWKVLLVTNQYPTAEHPGDAPCIEDQVEALRGLGVEVDVVVIDRFRSPWSYLRCALQMLWRNLHWRGHDVVHAFYGYAGLAALFQRRAPVVLTYRGSDLLGGIDGRIGRAIAPRVAGVVTMTEEMKERSGRRDARVIPFGIDLDRVRPVPTAEARRRLGLDPTAPLVLFPYDRRRRVKRFDLVEAVVERLRDEFPKIRILEVFDRPQEELALHMSACDLFLIASDYEGSPLAVREAMAMNLPVVSVPVGDVPELLDGVQYSSVVASQDVEALVEASRPVLRDRARSAGRERIAQFDASWSAREVIALYEEVTGQV